MKFLKCSTRYIVPLILVISLSFFGSSEFVSEAFAEDPDGEEYFESDIVQDFCQWSEGQLLDSIFLDSLQSAINDGIPGIPSQQINTSQELPNWIREHFAFWCNGDMSYGMLHALIRDLVSDDLDIGEPYFKISFKPKPYPNDDDQWVLEGEVYPVEGLPNNNHPQFATVEFISSTGQVYIFNTDESSNDTVRVERHKDATHHKGGINKDFTPSDFLRVSTEWTVRVTFTPDHCSSNTQCTLVAEDSFLFRGDPVEDRQLTVRLPLVIVAPEPEVVTWWVGSDVSVSSSNKIWIRDNNMNINEFIRDAFDVEITSDSDPIGITVLARESNGRSCVTWEHMFMPQPPVENCGTFFASFYLTEDEFSNGSTLRVAYDDTVYVTYTSTQNQTLSKTAVADLRVDLDGDSVADIHDNCRGVSNPLQTDYDQNGIGDLCEKKVPLYRSSHGSSDHFYTTNEDEWNDAAEYYPPWVKEGIAAYVFNTPVREDLVPLYRSYNQNINDHFYTTNEDEWNDAAEYYPPWVKEGIAAYVFNTHVEGTVPLYRSWSGSDHFYTTNMSEHVDFNNNGYVDEGVAAYVYDPLVEPTPLYRSWSGSDHFYTTDMSEHVDFNNNDYIDEGIAAYVYKTKVGYTVPLYRSYNQNINDHFYTTNEDEWNDAAEYYPPWVKEGIAAYVFNTHVEGTVPLYRSWSGSDHFYTTNMSEHVDFNNNGYVDEGVAAYVYDPQVSSMPLPNYSWRISSDDASGTAYIYISDPTSDLKKPIIIPDGFDYEDKRGNNIIFSMLSQQNLVQTLLDEGYDIIILNFDDGAGYIQHNAVLLEKLIQRVNEEKVGYEQIIVMGPSMGGLTARYALLDMEEKGLDHNVWLYISFDAPNQGANIPLGNQFFLEFFKPDSPAVADAQNELFSTAAKQMLIYHESEVSYGSAANPSPAKADPLFVKLYNELESMGNYPSDNIRIVAISNGNGEGIWKFDAGSKLIDYETSVDVHLYFDADIDVNVYSLPDGSGYIFHGLIDKPWPKANKELHAYVSNALPLDGAPGSPKIPTVSHDIVSMAPGASLGNDLLQDTETFIPTISALDIGTNDLDFIINGNYEIYDYTPFAHILAPSTDEPHMYISEKTKSFILCEIFQKNPDAYERHECAPIKFSGYITTTLGSHLLLLKVEHEFWNYPLMDWLNEEDLSFDFGCDPRDCDLQPDMMQSNSQILASWGYILYNQHHKEKADMFFDMAHEIEPDNPFVYVAKANALAQTHTSLDNNRISNLYETALSISPNESLILVSYGEFLTSNEDYGKANKMFNKILKANPDYVDAYAGLTYSHFKQAESLFDSANGMSEYVRALDLAKTAFTTYERVSEMSPDILESKQVENKINSLITKISTKTNTNNPVDTMLIIFAIVGVSITIGLIPVFYRKNN